MADYILSCCSTVDLTEDYLTNRDISYKAFRYFIDGKEYRDDFGQHLSYKDFYEKMRSGGEVRTTQINVDEFNEYFEELLEKNKNILHISFSSGLSGTYNSARIAAADVMEQHPEAKILVVDSLCASSGYGLLVDKLADLRDEGYSMDMLYKWAEDNKLRVHHWFFSTDLTFYVKGGRVSKVAGIFGTVLNICPLLNVDNHGKLIPRQKIRGKKNVIKLLPQVLLEHCQNGKNYNEKCFISNSDCVEDVNEVIKLLNELFTKIKDGIKVFDIGTTIGCHSGPGTVALFFWGDKRVN